MGEKGTVWLPEGVSTLAPEIDSLFYFVFWVSVVLFLGVVRTMAYLDFRFPALDWRTPSPNLARMADKLALRQRFGAPQPA